MYAANLSCSFCTVVAALLCLQTTQYALMICHRQHSCYSGSRLTGLNSAAAWNEAIPFSPFNCREGNFSALFKSIIVTICCCLRPGEGIYDVQNPLHVISAAACIVSDISLHAILHAGSQHAASCETNNVFLHSGSTSISICASSTPQFSWPS